jgi:hypothetical protein
MPTFIKHVGQVSSTGKKCVVVFRTIPGDKDSCVVVETESLADLYHDDLQRAVESDAAQSDVDFFKYAQRTSFHDGRNMLETLHTSGWMKKFPTSEITMMPTPDIKISLAELNTQLADLDLGRTTSGDINGSDDAPPLNGGKTPGVLDDEDLAMQMRSQADFFRRESERLLAEAEALSPSKAKVKETVTVASKERTTKPKAETVEAPKTKRAYNKKK